MDKYNNSDMIIVILEYMNVTYKDILHLCLHMILDFQITQYKMFLVEKFQSIVLL